MLRKRATPPRARLHRCNAMQSGGLDPHDLAVNLVGQCLDGLAELLREPREPRVLLEELEYLRALLRCQLLSLDACLAERLPVLRVRVGVRLVAIRLPGLGEQDQRGGVGRLQAEGEVQENERIDVEVGETDGVEHDPDRHHHRLPDQEGRGPEEAGKALRSDPEPVVAENRREVRVRRVKSEMMAGYLRCLASHEYLRWP